MQINTIINEELQIPIHIINKVLNLLNEGATIPFIARYRKEVTENLDEVQLINIKDRNAFWEEFFKRKQTVLQSIESQGKLTPEIRQKIEKCKLLTDLEDIYLPFKPKRKSKGQKAIEQGLKPLAVFIQHERNEIRIVDKAFSFVNGEIETEQHAIEGAIHILAEEIAEDSLVRERIRSQFKRFGQVIAKVKKSKKEEAEKYKDYFDFSESINHIASHRILALLRAENEDYLNVKIEVDVDKAKENVERIIYRNFANNSYFYDAISESYKRILQPNFESEIKKYLKEKADLESILVFAENLKQLLLQAPLGAKNVLAIDPGYRTGCKIAILNKNGGFVENTTIYPHPPQNKIFETEEKLKSLVKKYDIEAVAIGNGTAGLETEKLCRKLFKNTDILIFSVNEAGASIYSASEIARDEFAELDLTVRGSISIGRRLMDPLAELVKIDAKSIGVGQYQHDVNQPLLKQKLTEVVEHCVNHVGVELNTASYPILSYISGLGTVLAKNIVAYREENGNFTERKELLKVPKMGKKTYEQAAGFLRIENGKNPLDNTIIHPETYKIVDEIVKKNQTTLVNVLQHKTHLNKEVYQTLKEKYNSYTIDFILQELEKPTRDPREFLLEPKYNAIESIDDIYPGMILLGRINNITNFGAFVDIGIKESGLVHISEISNTYISNIHDAIRLNQQIEVKVLLVDSQRNRIQLSIKQVE